MEHSFISSILEISYMSLYAITLVFALWRYPKYFDTPLRYLPILFLYTFLNELLGNLVAIDENIALTFRDLTDNSIIYNLYTIISYLYYYYIFWSFSKNPIAKKYILYGGIIFLISCGINVFLQSFASDSQVISYTIGGCVLLFCTISYLRHFIFLKQKFEYKQTILFWLSLGLSIFYMGYLPLKINWFYDAARGLGASHTSRIFHLSLIIIMYSFFVIGFYKMKRPLSKIVIM